MSSFSEQTYISDEGDEMRKRIARIFADTVDEGLGSPEIVDSSEIIHQETAEILSFPPKSISDDTNPIAETTPEDALAEVYDIFHSMEIKAGPIPESIIIREVGGRVEELRRRQTDRQYLIDEDSYELAA
jgi:hypothetical protein